MPKSNETTISVASNAVDNFLVLFGNMTKDELIQVRTNLTAIGNDFSQNSEKRRMSKEFLKMVRREIKQFG